MKLLHVITSLYTGGAEMLVVNLVPRFQALGHEVGVVVFNGGHTPLMERLEKECPNCKLYKLGDSFYNPWYIIKLVKIMRDYDIVHTHNSSPQLYAAIANLFCRKKLVTTEHNTNNRKRGNCLLSKIDRWMYSRYDRVICISNQAETNLRKYLKKGELKTQIETIYNGVDIESIRSAKPIMGLRKGKFVAVMVSAFRPQKDHETLVKAMTKLPADKYEIWLVGGGESYDKVVQLVHELKVEQNVMFWGVRTDVYNILKSADVVVMSTHYEGLSLSNIEGMAVGKPFIASDVEGIREITKEYGILVPHQDVDALAKAIEQLHDDKQFYKGIADRCYERANQFDISKMVSRYNHVYSSIFKV